MDKSERDQLLGQIGVKADDDGVHITLSNDRERHALADSIRNTDAPLSFGSAPTKVFIEPSSSQPTGRQAQG
jgi:hypothetical protein